MELYFVTSNPGKVSDFEAIIRIPFKTVSLELPEIQSLELHEIVEHKVNAAFEQIKKPVIVDDVGFYLKAWNGFPGPFVKYLLAAGGNELLLRMLQHEENREVSTRAGIGYHDGENVHVFIGEANGVVSRDVRGNKGWGWDSIFQQDGYSETYGEMDRDLRNSISCRRVAIEKFHAFLNSAAL